MRRVASSSGDPATLADNARRARPVSLAGEQVLPVVAALESLLPDRGLRRGSTIVVRPGPAGGATSLALALGVAASHAGSWCAAVGLPSMGMVAAEGLGMELERLAQVPQPGRQWAAVMAALIDAVDVILVRPPRGVRPADARRLPARARERGVVLVLCGEGWPEGTDLRLDGRSGRLAGPGPRPWAPAGRSVEWSALGRGAASRERRARLWLPGPDGRMAVDDRAVGVGAPSVGVRAAGVRAAVAG